MSCFNSAFNARKFIEIVSYLYESADAGEKFEDLLSYLNHNYKTVIFDSGGNCILCGIDLGGGFFISINDDSYVVYENKNNRQQPVDWDLEVTNSPIVIQDIYWKYD